MTVREAAELDETIVAALARLFGCPLPDPETAARIAARIAFGTLGTDTGGSIRLSAAAQERATRWHERLPPLRWAYRPRLRSCDPADPRTASRLAAGPLQPPQDQTISRHRSHA